MEQEIRERSEFLADMERLGKGQQYKNIISTEISQVGLMMEGYRPQAVLPIK